jgi:hypothetical protein
VDVLDTERRRYRHHAQSRHRDARLAHTPTWRSEVTGEGLGERRRRDDVWLNLLTFGPPMDSLRFKPVANRNC